MPFICPSFENAKDYVYKRPVLELQIPLLRLRAARSLW
jgi:hypothetical protein